MRSCVPSEFIIFYYLPSVRLGNPAHPCSAHMVWTPMHSYFYGSKPITFRLQTSARRHSRNMAMPMRGRFRIFTVTKGLAASQREVERSLYIPTPWQAASCFRERERQVVHSAEALDRPA